MFKKYFLLLIVCAFAFSCSATAMEKEITYQESQFSFPSYFEQLPREINLLILEHIINDAKTPEEAVFNIRKLREASKKVKAFIESESTTKFIIQKLVQKFECQEFDMILRYHNVFMPKLRKLIDREGIAKFTEFFWQQFGLKVEGPRGNMELVRDPSLPIYFSELEAAELLATPGINTQYITQWLDQLRPRIVFMRQLQHAVHAGDYNLLKELLQNNKSTLKIDLNSLKICNRPMLFETLPQGKESELLLLDADADLFLNWLTRFEDAVLSADTEYLHALLQDNITDEDYQRDLNKITIEGYPLLFYLIRKDFPEGLEILVKAGLNSNIRNQKGKTLYTYFFEMWGTCDLNGDEFIPLLAKIANINDFDANGDTILIRQIRDCYSDDNQFFHDVELMLDNGADPNIRDPKGLNAWDYIELGIKKNPHYDYGRLINLLISKGLESVV